MQQAMNRLWHSPYENHREIKKFGDLAVKVLSQLYIVIHTRAVWSKRLIRCRLMPV